MSTTIQVACDNCQKVIPYLSGFHVQDKNKIQHSISLTPGQTFGLDFCDKKCLKEWFNKNGSTST